MHYIIKVLDSDAIHCDCTFTLSVLTLRNYKILQRNFSKILYQKHRYKLFCRTSKLTASKQASNNHVITFCAYTKAIDTVNKLFICPDCSLFFFLFYALFFYLLIFFYGYVFLVTFISGRYLVKKTYTLSTLKSISF